MKQSEVIDEDMVGMRMNELRVIDEGKQVELRLDGLTNESSSPINSSSLLNLLYFTRISIDCTYLPTFAV